LPAKFFTAVFIVAGMISSASAVEVPKPVITINVPRPAINIPKPAITVSRPAINVPRPTINASRPAITTATPVVTRPSVSAGTKYVPKADFAATRPKTNLEHQAIEKPKLETPATGTPTAKLNSPLPGSTSKEAKSALKPSTSTEGANTVSSPAGKLSNEAKTSSGTPPEPKAQSKASTPQSSAPPMPGGNCTPETCVVGQQYTYYGSDWSANTGSGVISHTGCATGCVVTYTANMVTVSGQPPPTQAIDTPRVLQGTPVQGTQNNNGPNTGTVSAWPAANPPVVAPPAAGEPPSPSPVQSPQLTVQLPPPAPNQGSISGTQTTVSPVTPSPQTGQSAAVAAPGATASSQPPVPITGEFSQPTTSQPAQNPAASGALSWADMTDDQRQALADKNRIEQAKAAVAKDPITGEQAMTQQQAEKGLNQPGTNALPPGDPTLDNKPVVGSPDSNLFGIVTRQYNNLQSTGRLP
jgi:hypothetical protein